MTRTPGSIVGWLILTLTLGITILWLVASAFSTGILRHELNETFDRALMENAHRLLPLVADSVDEGEGEGAEVHEIHQLGTGDDYGLPYQVLRGDGRILIRSDDAPADPFDAAARNGFSEAGEYRVFTLVDPQSGLGIQVGDPLKRRERALLNSTLTLFLPLLLLIPLSIAGVWLAVRRGLRPLTTLQLEIAARDSANLQPLSLAGLPRELVPIGSALSRLIDRLRGALESERQFAANSAHELRTPIAGALAQTQRLIETSSDDQARAEARKIEATLRRLADLAERLMQLARADSGMARSAEPVAVLPALKLVIADARARSRPPRSIDLTIAPGAETTNARINVDALGIVLRNLVDNALAHSPPESPVEVVLDTGRRIVIRNASPLIPAETLARLRHRFERGPTPASGSGLGLAIAETMLHQVGGTLTLRSPVQGRPDGFEAVVELAG